MRPRVELVTILLEDALPHLPANPAVASALEILADGLRRQVDYSPLPRSSCRISPLIRLYSSRPISSPVYQDFKVPGGSSKSAFLPPAQQNPPPRKPRRNRKQASIMNTNIPMNGRIHQPAGQTKHGNMGFSS